MNAIRQFVVSCTAPRLACVRMTSTTTDNSKRVKHLNDKTDDQGDQLVKPGHLVGQTEYGLLYNLPRFKHHTGRGCLNIMKDVIEVLPATILTEYSTTCCIVVPNHCTVYELILLKILMRLMRCEKVSDNDVMQLDGHAFLNSAIIHQTEEKPCDAVQTVTAKLPGHENRKWAMGILDGEEAPCWMFTPYAVNTNNHNNVFSTTNVAKELKDVLPKGHTIETFHELLTNENMRDQYDALIIPTCGLQLGAVCDPLLRMDEYSGDVPHLRQSMKINKSVEQLIDAFRSDGRVVVFMDSSLTLLHAVLMQHDGSYIPPSEQQQDANNSDSQQAVTVCNISSNHYVGQTMLPLKQLMEHHQNVHVLDDTNDLNCVSMDMANLVLTFNSGLHEGVEHIESPSTIPPLDKIAVAKGRLETFLTALQHMCTVAAGTRLKKHSIAVDEILRKVVKTKQKIEENRKQRERRQAEEWAHGQRQEAPDTIFQPPDTRTQIEFDKHEKLEE